MPRNNLNYTKEQLVRDENFVWEKNITNKVRTTKFKRNIRKS